MISLYEYQISAVNQMKNGSILCGGVGSGKSLTSLFYYMKNDLERDLYIITTAKKRDSMEWQLDCSKAGLTSLSNIVIDSWNNIKKYSNIYGGFFIFDEQRVVGSGVWVKSFLRISKRNHWVLLSATPGDQWSDYVPVFVANGFYKNKTEFINKHCIYSRFAKYPKIDRYIGTKELQQNLDSILVMMKDNRTTKRHDLKIDVNYDKDLYRTVMKDRWDPYDNCPIAETGKLFYLLRKVVNSDDDRLDKMEDIIFERKKVIVFYNFDYELDLIKDYLSHMFYSKDEIYEWNGHKHDELPGEDTDRWVYLVQYAAGCEGWNCIITDTIIFYSQNYSYRITEQASGRIDRINTPYEDLYYYHLVSSSPIDLAIQRALKDKKTFNEKNFIRNIEK